MASSRLLRLLACAMATLFFGTCLVLTYPLVWLSRMLVSLLATIFRRDLNGILKPMSAGMACEGVYGRCPEFNLQAIKFAENDLQIGTLRQVVGEAFKPLVECPREDFEYEHMRDTTTTFCGYWFWKRTKFFELSSYVREYKDVVKESQEFEEQEEPKKLPLKPYYTDEDLKLILGVLTTKKWRSDHSPWEAILLKNYVPDETSADLKKLDVVMLRVHHCLGDGYSLRHLILNKMMKYQGDPVAIPSYEKQTLSVWWKLVRSAALPFKMYADFTVHLANRQFDQNEWASAGTPENSKYFATFSPAVPLRRVKSIKNKFGVSFIAVAHAAVAGAVRKLMVETGVDKVPGKISCFVPFALPKHRLGLRIHAAVAVVSWPTGEADAAKRLRAVETSLRSQRYSLAPLLEKRILWYFLSLPNWLIEYTPANNSGFTLGMSSFPGNSGEVCITSEHRCPKAFFLAGLPKKSPMACAITSYSMMDNIIFSLSIRKHICPSQEVAEKFHQFFEEEMKALEDAAASSQQESV